MILDAPIKRVRWATAHRIINSRYPPIDVFERVADPADCEMLHAVEMLTNPRMRQEWGEISLVPVDERVSGPNASWVMAPFTHTGHPSRFSDGRYGVYYAAKAVETSVHEAAFHFGRFLAATREPPGTLLELRVLVSHRIDHRYHDVRGAYPALHDPNDCGAAQRFGKALRELGSSGIVYASIRHEGGECLAVFRPKAIPRPIQGPHLRFHFDGTRVDRWFVLGGSDWHSL